jgi:hypothetical protein
MLRKIGRCKWALKMLSRSSGMLGEGAAGADAVDPTGIGRRVVLSEGRLRICDCAVVIAGDLTSPPLMSSP